MEHLNSVCSLPGEPAPAFPGTAPGISTRSIGMGTFRGMVDPVRRPGNTGPVFTRIPGIVNRVFVLFVRSFAHCFYGGSRSLQSGTLRRVREELNGAYWKTPAFLFVIPGSSGRFRPGPTIRSVPADRSHVPGGSGRGAWWHGKRGRNRWRFPLLGTPREIA
jgi:hypothetical protein